MITNMIRVYVLISFYDENGLHKAGSVTLVKEEDFNPLYMKAIPVPPTVDAYTKEETNALLNTKQDTLTAGTGITITNNVISAEGGSGSVIDNIQLSGTGSYVQSMDIDSDTYSFSTVENDQPAYDSDILASVDLNGNSYKLFYLDNFQYNSDGYVTSFDDGDSNNYAFCNVGNVDTDTEGKVKSMDINSSSAEFVSIENISTQGPNGEVDAMDINGSSYSFATGGSVIENISTQGPNGEVDSMDIDGDTYTFYTGSGIDELVDLDDVNISSPSNGQVLTYNSTSQKWENANAGGGGGGSSLVVTLTGAYQGATIDLSGMNQGSSVNLNATKTYAEMKAADEIIFKIVETTTSRTANKYTLKPTGMCTSTATGDQSLFYTFSVITPDVSTPKVFRLEVSPWSNMLVCVA